MSFTNIRTFLFTRSSAVV